MTVALVFPGQGSQAVGMGKALAEAFAPARQVFDDVDAALGESLSDTIWSGPGETLTLTENAQPALMAVSIAALRVLEQEAGLNIGRDVAFVAGHSLGEYSALAAARAISVADAARLLRIRGRAMQKAVPVGVGAMAAILGMDLDKVTAICNDAAQGEVCEPANINSPEQIVISGNTAAVERAAKLADERGAKKAKLLPVSAPFHCALMKPAQDRLEADLTAIRMQKPVYPVACNVDASLVTDEQRAGDTLLRQVTGSVKWDACVRLLISQGVDTFIEVGPGKVLWGLMRQIDRSRTALNVSDDATLTKALESLGQVPA